MARKFDSLANLSWLGVLMFAVSVQAEESKLQVINDSGETIELFLLRPSAERESKGKVLAGKSLIVDSTIGRQFAIQTTQGNESATLICRQRIQGYRFQRFGCVDLADRPADRWPDNVVIPVTLEMNVPSHYTKIIFADQYPIVGSREVNDYALKEAAFLIRRMFSHRDDLRIAMIASGSRMCVMGHDEFTTDLPEHRSLANRSPIPGVDGRDYWDARARGLGGSEDDPYCSCGEENLLGFPGDPYSAENILIHEFAHNIHLRGMNNIDPTFDDRLQRTYQQAMKKKLWEHKYASVDRYEYFAEGVQSWFDDNREDDHDHNHVNTRAELVEYDPGLAAMCQEVFGETELKYTKPATRLVGHLEGYQPKSAPKFVWPERLQHAKKLIRQKAEQRGK